MTYTAKKKRKQFFLIFLDEKSNLLRRFRKTHTDVFLTKKIQFILNFRQHDFSTQQSWNVFQAGRLINRPITIEQQIGRKISTLGLIILKKVVYTEC